MITEEKLIPVRSESELRVGMLIVGTGCSECGGGSHRGLLIESRQVRRGLELGEYRPCMHGDVGATSTAWQFAPGLCWDVPVILCCGCALGRIYRVDTGLTDEASPYVAVPRPLKAGAR